MSTDRNGSTNQNNGQGGTTQSQLTTPVQSLHSSPVQSPQATPVQSPQATPVQSPQAETAQSPEEPQQRTPSREQSYYSLSETRTPQSQIPTQTNQDEQQSQEQQVERGTLQQEQSPEQTQPASQSQQPEQSHQSPPEFQQQPAPAVLVVQQPIILGRGAYVRRGHPFMHRGVQLSNGRKIGLNCMVSLGLFGGVFIMLGLMYGISSPRGFLCLLIGGIQFGACIRLCHKAKQDFDALPQDHPDRVTYSAPIVFSRAAREIASSTTTYQLPPGTQIIPSSTLQGEQGAQSYQLPAGTQVLNSTSALNSRLTSPSFLQQAFGHSSSGRTSAEEDKPPSYEEVCKQMRL